MYHNPLKPKITNQVDTETGDVVPTEEAMSWVDAAKVALLLTVAQVFMVFLPGTPLPLTMEFYFELLIFIGQSFFSGFITLTGLSYVYKPKK